MIPKLKSLLNTVILLTIITITAVSCANHKFKIKGEVYGAEEKSIILEKSDFYGRWMPVDSTRINRNGGFSFSFPAPDAPEIYRLSLNNQFIYLPVDSTETITVITSYDKFGSDFSLGGSRNAEMMAQFEKELQKADTTEPEEMDNFKRTVYSTYMKDFPGSILSFYILTKTVEGKPLYNPTDRNDSKYFAAVATGYKTARPQDPHALLLEQTALQSMKQRNNEAGNYRTLEADEVSLIDINLPDENGIDVPLSSVVNRGKPVVVIFSLLNQQESPELNMALAKIYNRLNGNTVFYNVSLDSDQYEWREAARNLPWITVYSPGGINSADAVRYNVFRIPSFFIYNSEGELVERPMTVEELDKSL